MRVIKNKLVLIIAIMLIFTLMLKNEYRTEAYVNKKNIVILIDNSISMKENENGIGNLAKIAGNMVIDSIKEEEVNISIVTFGTKVSILKELKDNFQPEKLKELVNSIEFNEAGTNVKDAIKDSISKLNDVKGDKSIIILSDGKEDPVGGLTETHKEQLNGLIDEATKSNIKVNTIALSDSVDKNFLNNIASNTGGNFRDGQTANKLFHSLISIIGLENNFTTIDNYTTSDFKNKEIFLSAMTKEVIINVVACDNKKPQIKVTLNNEIIEPLSTGEMYYVYRFDVNKNDTSKLNIIAYNDEISDVIVQFKSNASIKIDSDINNYISLPQNIPVDLKLLLDTADDKNIEGTFIEVNDGRILKTTEEIGVFSDHFEKNNIGENIIRYTARDKNNGIIAVNEINIYRSNIPAYYYDKIQDSLLKDEKFRIGISKKDNKNVEELSGELVIIKGNSTRQVPMSINGENLIVEEEISEIGNIKYYVNIRGKDKDNGELFAYSLPIKTLYVQEKPNILLEYLNYEETEIIQNKQNKIILTISDKSFIDEDTEVTVLDSEKNVIGIFNIGKYESGSKEVSVNPKNKEKNLKLYFETNNGIGITENIETNLVVNSYLISNLKAYSKIFIYFILPLIVLISVIIVLFKYFKKKYCEYIEDYIREVAIRYYVKPDCINGNIIGELSDANREFYLSFNNKRNIVEKEEDLSEQLIRFYIENVNENKLIILQVILYLLNKDKIFRFDCELIGDCIEKDYENIVDDVIKSISFKVGKKIINIEYR